MYNGHADVTCLITASGDIEAIYYYDAFGNHLDTTGNKDNPYRYSGYQYDEETDLYYLNARYYDSKIARFLTEDTYGGQYNDPLSLNRYTYCANNPLIYYDPTGNTYIERGDSGDGVVALQEHLIDLGYNLGSWGADGSFGGATYAAVLQFQNDYGLQADGIVGNQTWTTITTAAALIDAPDFVDADQQIAQAANTAVGHISDDTVVVSKSEHDKIIKNIENEVAANGSSQAVLNYSNDTISEKEVLPINCGNTNKFSNDIEYNSNESIFNNFDYSSNDFNIYYPTNYNTETLFDPYTNNNKLIPDELIEFFDPDVEKYQANFQDGIYRGEITATLGYSEGNSRLQSNESFGGKSSIRAGVNSKTSVFNLNGEIGVGDKNTSVMIKGVGDYCTASTFAGIEYTDELYIGAKAKASIVSGRATVEFTVFGVEIEVGVSGHAGSIGGEAYVGYTKERGFQMKFGLSAIFGAGYEFRFKPVNQ
jgi:RHS repeat-associated protein